MRHRGWQMILLMICLLSVGCGGLPSADKKRAQALPKQIEETTKFVNERSTAFTNWQKSPEYKDWQDYAEREKWSDNINSAKNAVEHARQINQTEVSVTLKKNEGKDLTALQNQLDRASKSLQEAKEKSLLPFSRLEQLKKTKSEATAIVAKALSDQAQLNEWFDNLAGKTSQATGNFADSTQKIEAHFAAIRKLHSEANAAAVIVNQEFARGNGADWSKLADNATAVSTNLNQIKEQGSKHIADLDALYKSYSKILVDAKYEHYLTIGRVSWDEDADWPTEHNYNYPPVLVDDKTAQYYIGFAETSIGYASRGFLGSLSFNSQVGGMWNILGLDPMVNWPSSWDDLAEYYVADLDTKYFHKYSLSNNESTTETDWQEVSDEFYEANVNNLNMALESKPYGDFENEKQVVATPPGMASVGNPRYGQWRRDPSTGRNFWEFYGQYRLMQDLLGTNRYYYDDWSTWRNNYRGRTAYYGDHDGEWRYGSRSSGVQSHPRFSRSNFAQRGGFHDLDDDQPTRTYSRVGSSGNSSIRGAGPASRGGGSGGSGK